MARGNYTPKSKYLIVYHNSFYDFYYLSFRPYAKFVKGQEEEFIETMQEYKKYYGENGGHADIEAVQELKSLMKYSTLDWNKIWKKVKLSDYCGPLREFIEELSYYIDWETFKNKVNQSNNLVLVERLYHYYCWCNDIKGKTKDRAYNAYLVNALSKMKKTPEDALCDMIDDYDDSFERGWGPDTVETALQKSKYRLFRKLIQMSNLDTLVDLPNETKKVPLKNLLFYRILRYGAVSEWKSDCDRYNNEPNLKVDHEEHLKNLFKACDDLIFTGEPLNEEFDEYDRATLNIMMNNIDEAYEIFESKDYPLYDQEQISDLLEIGICQDYEPPFVDRFANIIRFLYLKDAKSLLPNGHNHDVFRYFIYNDKVKAISYPTLMLIKAHLTEREYTVYLKHIHDSNITIYLGDYLGLHNGPIRCINNAKYSVTNPFETVELNSVQEELKKYTKVLKK